MTNLGLRVLILGVGGLGGLGVVVVATLVAVAAYIDLGVRRELRADGLDLV